MSDRKITPLEGDSEVTVVVEKTFKGHTSGVNCVLYYPEKRKIVSSSDDKTLKTWCIDPDSDSINCEGTIRVHTDYATFLINWDGDDFLSCGRDGYVYHYRWIGGVVVKTSTVVVPVQSVSFLYNMLRISSDSFLLYEWGNRNLREFTFNGKSGTLKRTMKRHSAHTRTMMVKSSYFENCVYFNTYEHSNYVTELINYDEEKIICEFQNPDNSLFNDLAIYKNFEGDEILVGGGSAFLYFFNGSKQEIHHFKKILLRPDGITSIFILNDRYIFVGGYNDGGLSIFDTHQNFRQIHYSKSIHRVNIYGMLPMIDPKRQGVDGYLRLITYSHDGLIKILKVGGLQGLTDLSQEDCMERVAYLNEELEKNSDSSLTISVRCYGGDFTVFKSFLHL